METNEQLNNSDTSSGKILQEENSKKTYAETFLKQRELKVERKSVYRQTTLHFIVVKHHHTTSTIYSNVVKLLHFGWVLEILLRPDAVKSSRYYLRKECSHGSKVLEGSVKTTKYFQKLHKT